MCISQKLYFEAFLISNTSSLLFITHLNNSCVNFINGPWNFLTIEKKKLFCCRNWLLYSELTLVLQLVKGRHRQSFIINR